MDHVRIDYGGQVMLKKTLPEEESYESMFSSPSSSPRLRPPPDKLHPTLSSWLKNMNKLDSLINRLQELASAAPPDYRPQLLNKVAALRTTFKRNKNALSSFYNSARSMPTNIYSTSPPRFNNRAPFWTIWKSAWKPQTSYRVTLLICKCFTSLEQFIL